MALEQQFSPNVYAPGTRAASPRGLAEFLSTQVRLLETLTTDQPMPEMLAALVRSIESHGEGTFGSILLIDEAGERLYHGAAPSLPEEYIRQIDGFRIGPEVGSCGSAAFQRRRVIVEDVETDPRWADYKHLLHPHGLRACWSDPIFDSEGKLLGTFAIYYREPRRPNETDQMLIDVGSHLAGIAIESRRRREDLHRAGADLEERVRQRTAELQSLASELSLTAERERHRIAADLHDRIGQSLGLTRMRLETLREDVPADTTSAIDECLDLVGQIISDTRTLEFELSPPLLYDLGFEPAVEWLVDQHRKPDGPRFVLVDDGQSKPLSEVVRVLLFRATREVVLNVIKHAGAHEVRLALQRDDNRIRITVVDDGVGFDVESLDLSGVPRGFGLFSVREQLTRLGGDLRIDSTPGEGTTVTLRGPLEPGPFSGAGI